MSKHSGLHVSCAMVRFYYGEQTGETFKKMAYDDYHESEVKTHEDLLKKEGIDYLKVPLSPMPHELIDPS
jgi:hypothetical protein